MSAIIALIEQTASIPDLVWLFIGGGAGRDRLKQVAVERAIVNITFTTYAACGALSESLARADLHLVSLDPASEGLIMPSKLYGIMAAGRPTLCLGSPEGAVTRILLTHDAGRMLDSTCPDTYLPTIQALMNDPDRLVVMGRNARRAFKRHYSAERSLEAWLEVLTEAEATPNVENLSERAAS